MLLNVKKICIASKMQIKVINICKTYYFLRTVCFSIIGIGTADSWSSPALPHLQSNNSDFPVTELEASSIASTSDLGSIFGILLSPIFSSILGRKYCILIFTAPQLITWLMIIFAKNVITLYIARFLGGVASALVINFSMMYIGEIADKHIRGKLLSILKISKQVGFLVVKAAGAYLSYKTMNISMISIPIIFFLTFIFMPESPYYLLIRNQERKGLETLMKLRGTKSLEKVKSELSNVEISVKESQENKRWAFRELLFERGHRKSLFIVFLAVWTKYLSGFTPIEAYTQEILGFISDTWPTEQVTIILSVIGLIMGLLSTQIIDRFGRRKSYLYSGIFSTIGLIIVGIYFFIKFYLKVDLSSFTWIPFAGLIFYNVAFNLGISNVTYCLIGEMFGISVKVTAIVCVSLTTDGISFLVKVIFHWMNMTAGIYTTFLIYAICCISGSFLFFWIAPETKGKTLEEIQKIFHS